MFTGQFYHCTFRFLLGSVGIGLLSCGLAQPRAWGQVQTLSAGDADQQWREAQLQAFDRQLADDKLPAELIREIKAQRAWLEAWEPKSPSPRPDASPSADTSATDSAAAEAAGKEQDSQKAGEKANGTAEQKQDAKDSNAKDKTAEEPKPLEEPIIDPDKLAKDLRSRLFDPRRPATVADTKALQTALAEHSGDVGLRQLQLHWLDQPNYRDVHWKEISSAADRVLALLSELPATEETKIAAAWANYRKARALAHALRGRPLRDAKIAGVDKLSEDDREQMQNAIAECWRQIETLVGAGHPEFFQLEMYTLRRYGWSGQALELLERNAKSVDESAYLAERQSILEALRWTAPAERTAAEMKAKSASSDAKATRGFEIQYVPQAEAK